MSENEKLDLILSKLGGLEKEVQGVRTELKEEIAGVRTELKEEIEELRTELKEEIAGVRTELKEEIAGVRAELKEEIEELRTEIADIREELNEVKLILENEVRTNIQRIAEGHLDLSRNLHEAIKPSHEMEVLSVRVGILETDVEAIKKKIS